MEVQPHSGKSADTSFMDRAKSKLAEMSEGGDLYTPSEAEPPAKKKWNKYTPKAKQEETRTEFATLVSTIVVLGVLAWKAPDSVKPNGEEINAVSYHLAGIITRHIDISSAMTKDVLDTIGILAVSASYLTRVSPEMKRLSGNDGSSNLPPRPPSPSPFPLPPEPDEVDRADHSSMPNVSKDTSDFLDNLSRKVGE